MRGPQIAAGRRPAGQGHGRAAVRYVGGLSLAAIGEVLRAMDDPGRPVHKVLGAAADRVTPTGGETAGPELEDARREVAELLRRRGRQADARGSAAESPAGGLCALHRAGHGGYIDLLDVYADAAEPVARADLDYAQRWVAREDLAESVVVGTVLGEAMFGALRRLAPVDVSYLRFESPEYLSGPVEPVEPVEPGGWGGLGGLRRRGGGPCGRLKPGPVGRPVAPLDRTDPARRDVRRTGSGVCSSGSQVSSRSGSRRPEATRRPRSSAAGLRACGRAGPR
ncbi:MerR family transcriptional regulator [Streptomyces parvus]|uniref:MerR family transcriptional regulator n=1 Tax=Streptomyces parvus TaxID=66428 RepID=UPI003571166C